MCQRAQTIRQLARDYARTKPAALIQAGVHSATTAGRTHRAWPSTPLATLTQANVGVKRWWAAIGGCANWKFAVGSDMPDNPVKAKISVMNWV